MFSQRLYFLFLDVTKLMIQPHSVIEWVDHTFTARFFYNTFKYILIPSLLCIILYFFILLLFNRYQEDKMDDKIEAIEQELNSFLTELLYSNYPIATIKEKVDSFKKRPEFQQKWCKQLLLNKLIHIKHNVKELDKNLFLIIYKQLDLHQYSAKLIQNKRWYYKSLGFYHYQSLDYKIKKSNIKPYLESPNRYLKSNALIALIALSDEKFDILHNYPNKIAKADELKILDLIYHKQSTTPETVKDWLQCTNSSVVVLAIKLMVRYREQLSLPTISYLLLHEDKEVRKETIIAIRDLVIFDAHSEIMHSYAKESDTRIRISMLKTLAIIGNERVKKFAIQHLETEKDIDVQFELVNCIHKIDPNYFQFIQKEKEEASLFQQMISHLNCPYLH